MNNLPPEILNFIFNFVPIQYQFKLRIVSKLWKEIIDKFKPESLILNIYDVKEKPCFDLIKIKDQISFLQIKSLPRFKRLKKLSTKFHNLVLLDPTNFYNQFIELKELEIDDSFYSGNINLNLKKLEKFKNNNHQIRFELETPELSNLTCNRLINLNLNYPDKIKELSILSWWCESSDRIKLIELINLEILTMNYDSDGLITDFVLEKLTNLKELNIENVSEQQNRQTFRRKDLKMFYFGFDIDQFKAIVQNNETNELEFELENDQLNYIIENYKQINQTKGDYELNYNDFESLIINKLPVDFYERIKKINTLNITDKIEDEIKLLNVIEKTKINKLFVDNNLFSRSFYDQLITKGQSLKIIYLSLKNAEPNVLNEFDFIFKLENLKQITIYNHILDLNFLIKIIKKPNFIDFVRLEHNNGSFLEVLNLDYNNFYDFADNISLGAELEFNDNLDVENLLIDDLDFIEINRNLSTNNDNEILNLIEFINHNYKEPKSLDFIFLIDKIIYSDFLIPSIAAAAKLL